MKTFFKFVFASCLGTILAFVAIGLIFAVIGGIAAAGNKSPVQDGILLLDFGTPVPEKTGNVATQAFSFDTPSDLGLYRIQKLIKHAQTDPSVKGIVYKVSAATPLGLATASSMRESLKEFRDSTDKFIYTYADFFDNTSYLLASSSDSIFVNPNGILDINGYGTMIPFFKGAMEKLGVDMNIFYAGQFKSATEPFRRKEMSEQNKIQTRQYLNDNYQLYLEEVAEARSISVANLKTMIGELDLDNTTRAIELGLVDGHSHWFEFEDRLRDKLGIKEGKNINYTRLDDYSLDTHIGSGSSKNRVALVFAEGEVQYDADSKGVITEGEYHKIFDKIRKDKKVKAVVLRVNSPGGSAFTSDVIWRETKELQARGIPVIASFGDYAASGGYYIAASADTIVSHPKTLTGSIGVFSMMPDLTDFMDNKLGVTFDTVKTSPHAILLSPFFKLNGTEKNAMQAYTDNMYNQFLDVVADGRGKSRDEIHQVAQGRVWTGQKASEIGLVDVLGGIDRAIEIAAEKADLENYKVVEYPSIKKEFWEEILTEMSRSQRATLTEHILGKKEGAKVNKTMNEVQSMMKYREPMARLPFVLTN